MTDAPDRPMPASRLHAAGSALFVFVSITGLLLWAAGILRLGSSGDAASHAGEPSAADGEAPCCPDPDASHGKPGVAHPEAASGAAEALAPPATHPDSAQVVPASAPSDLEIRGAKPCEHGVPTIDCDTCRYELGVVKIQPSIASALLRTAAVEEHPVVHALRLTGEVQADPTRVVEIHPPVNGRIQRIAAALGQTVREGDLLAVLNAPELSEGKAAYLQALARRDLSVHERERQSAVSSSLEKLVAHLSGVAHDQGGPDCETEATGTPSERIGEWRSKLVGAASRLRMARSNRDRETLLAERGVSSQAERLAAVQEFQAAQAEFTALMEDARLALRLDAFRTETAAAEAEAGLRAAEHKLRVLGLDEAALRRLREAPDSTDFACLEVRAPRPGTVTVLQVAEGRFVEASQHLATISDLSVLWVWADLYERDLAAVHDAIAQGAPGAIVRVAAFPQATFAGSIDLLGSGMDEHTRTVKARVQVHNPAGRLRPGMFARIACDLPLGRSALFAPATSILSDAGTSFVFLRWKDAFWVRRDVETGIHQGDLVEIVRGVPPGSLVAAQGAFLLKSDVLREKMGAGCAD